MRLFIVPNNYDYHKQAELVVKANTKEEAIEKVKNHFKQYEGYKDGSLPENLELDKIEEFNEEVYENSGCDC